MPNVAKSNLYLYSFVLPTLWLCAHAIGVTFWPTYALFMHYILALMIKSTEDTAYKHSYS